MNIPPIPASSVQVLDIGRCFNDALEVFKKNVLILILAAIIFEVLSLFSLFILSGPLAGGTYLMCLAALSHPEKKIDIGLMFRMFGRFWPMVGLFFLTLLPTLLGLALLIVSGVLLMALWGFAFPIMVERNLGICASMRASSTIVLRRGLGQNLILAAIVFALGVSSSLIPYLGWVMGWVLQPISWLIISSAYIQQVHEREEDLADVFSPRGFPVEPATGGFPVHPATPPTA
jgi:uncharacterized membrane protein